MYCKEQGLVPAVCWISQGRPDGAARGEGLQGVGLPRHNHRGHACYQVNTMYIDRMKNKRKSINQSSGAGGAEIILWSQSCNYLFRLLLHCSGAEGILRLTLK